jgi:hypothetical protein
MARTADHRSPFTPGYGRQPLVFGGHEDIVQDIEDIFTTFDFGDSQSLPISGLRGAGKTSMLGLLRRRASDAGWFVITDDASTGLLRRVTGSTIPRLLDGLDEGERLRFTSFGVGPISAKWEKTPPLGRPQSHCFAISWLRLLQLVTTLGFSSPSTRCRRARFA